jgi:hypothetical protein
MFVNQQSVFRGKQQSWVSSNNFRRQATIVVIKQRSSSGSNSQSPWSSHSQSSTSNSRSAWSNRRSSLSTNSPSSVANNSLCCQATVFVVKQQSSSSRTVFIGKRRQVTVGLWYRNQSSLTSNKPSSLTSNTQSSLQSNGQSLFSSKVFVIKQQSVGVEQESGFVIK